LRPIFPLLGRIFLGALLTAGLVAGGLVLSGKSAKALSYVRGPVSASLPGLEVIMGSRVSAREVRVNERNLRVLECLTDKTPEQVLDHYEAIAKRQIRPGAPYLRQDGGAFASLLWVTPERITRGVLVSKGPAGKGSRYRLLLDESRQPLTLVNGEHSLPGGLTLGNLPGCKVGHSVVDEDGSGVLLLTSRGMPQDVTARILGPLEERGFKCDRTALDAYRGDGRLVIPLEHSQGGLRGVLKVTPQAGGARASLTLHGS
jgi:hypothetical protein